MKTNLKILFLSFIVSVLFCVGLKNRVCATEQASFSISPMNQKITLNSGERYYGTFKITNPGTNNYNFHYITSISPFKVNEDYNIVYENNGDYSQILDWITVENSEGVIAPNSTAVVRFYIDVPEDAPAGGQYAAIIVSSDDEEEAKEGLNIQSKYAIAHVLYAEVAGETVRKGEVDSISVPSFLFTGNIAGSATIENTGNVHSDAAYTLQVFPLFSKEESFTNEENPEVSTILPEAKRTTIVTWEDTPMLGIFHVIFKAEFEGVESKVDKYVIVCPIWLLFLLALALFLLIFRILSAKKKEKK